MVTGQQSSFPKEQVVQPSVHSLIWGWGVLKPQFGKGWSSPALSSPPCRRLCCVPLFLFKIGERKPSSRGRVCVSWHSPQVPGDLWPARGVSVGLSVGWEESSA